MRVKAKGNANKGPVKISTMSAKTLLFFKTEKERERGGRERERERKREREADRQRQRETETDKLRDRRKELVNHNM